MNNKKPTTWDRIERHYLRAMRFYVSLRKIGHTTRQSLTYTNQQVGLSEIAVTMEPHYLLHHLHLQDVFGMVEETKNYYQPQHWDIMILQMDQQIFKWSTEILIQCYQLVKLDPTAPLEVACDKLDEEGYPEESRLLKDWQRYYEPLTIVKEF